MRIILLVIMLGWTASGRAVQVGDSRASVLAELGAPQKKMAAGTREFLTYPAGRIELTNGLVTDIRGSFNQGTPASPAAAAATPPTPASPAPTTVPAPKARPAPTATWFTDIAEAQSTAAREKKLILALFTGSDWCPPCQQFEAEVAHDEQFAGIFSGSFVFFKSDWLRNTPQPEAVRDEVGRLKRKYWIQVYPTLLVLNAEGEKLTKVEWTTVQEGSFKEAMIEAIDTARKATKGGKKVSGGLWPF
ncbi:MAG TPA: thioredoxin family protein [Lacunisphaera sp.]|nr:thioredoxin family protein [Lacunisphaera sp.]